MSTTKKDPDGPLKLYWPTDPVLRAQVVSKKLHERASGYATSTKWLPEGLSDELDGLRERQIRYRNQVATELAAERDLATSFKAEDEAFKEQLREAFRKHPESPPADRRTPPEDRAAQAAAAEERVWSAIEVLAEVADEIVEYFRRNETQLLAPLNRALVDATDKRREAEEALAACTDVEFRARKLADWLMREADGEIAGFHKQPCPTDDRAPRGYVDPGTPLERPWHKVRDWARDESTADDVPPEPSDPPALRDLAEGVAA